MCVDGLSSMVISTRQHHQNVNQNVSARLNFILNVICNFLSNLLKLYIKIILIGIIKYSYTDIEQLFANNVIN